MLLFDEDLQARQAITARFMQAQALMGLGRRAEARRLLTGLLKSDPNHAAARDFSGFHAPRVRNETLLLEWVT
jgi:hypothetical protein